jgi:putative Mg2+ transporter-C (MgtC) family protein
MDLVQLNWRIGAVLSERKVSDRHFRCTTLTRQASFRIIEANLPSELYAHHVLGFGRDRIVNELDLRKMIGDRGFTIANLSCRLLEGDEQFEYRMTIKSRDRNAAEALSKHLRSLPEVIEF